MDNLAVWAILSGAARIRWRCVGILLVKGYLTSRGFRTQEVSFGPYAQFAADKLLPASSQLLL